MKIKGKFAKTYDRFVKRPSLLPAGLLDMVKSTSSKDILELGCGTGTVAVGLGLEGFNITGVDYSREMLKAARRKARENKVKIRFLLADVTDSKFDMHRRYDMILCLGNTLALFTNHSSLTRFLANCRKHLNPGGFLIFQQLNYDRILKEKPTTFAVDIDRDIVRFKQNRFLKGNIKVTITIVDGSVIPPRQTISSFKAKPWTKSEISKNMKNAGFKKIRYFGDYSLNKYSLKSKDLIIFAMA